jgi:hypothetical protein
METEVKPLVTADNWAKFCDTCHASGFLDYLDATEQITDDLSQRLKRAHDFASLQKEIEGLINDRKAFLNHAYDHLP